MSELSGTAAMQGGVREIVKLMRECDEARKEAKQLHVSNRALCFYIEYLQDELRDAKAKLQQLGETV